jgi:hypothetical protein
MKKKPDTYSKRISEIVRENAEQHTDIAAITGALAKSLERPSENALGLMKSERLVLPQITPDLLESIAIPIAQMRAKLVAYSKLRDCAANSDLGSCPLLNSGIPFKSCATIHLCVAENSGGFGVGVEEASDGQLRRVPFLRSSSARVESAPRPGKKMVSIGILNLSKLGCRRA